MNFDLIKPKLERYFNVNLKELFSYPENFKPYKLNGMVQVLPDRESTFLQNILHNDQIKTTVKDGITQIVGENETFLLESSILIFYWEVQTYLMLIPREIKLTIISYDYVTLPDIIMFFGLNLTRDDVIFLLYLTQPRLMNVINKFNLFDRINTDLYTALTESRYRCYLKFKDFITAMDDDNTFTCIIRYQDPILRRVALYTKYPLVYNAFLRDPTLWDHVTDIMIRVNNFKKVSGVSSFTRMVFGTILGSRKTTTDDLLMLYNISGSLTQMGTNKMISWIYLLVTQIDMLDYHDIIIITNNLKKFDTPEHSYSEIYKQKVKDEAPEFYKFLKEK